MSEEVTGAYDPTAPDGDDYGRSQYVSKRDVRVIAVFLIILALAAIPIFKMLERNAHKSTCRSNLGAIADAMNQYASLHDDRFPPIMRTGSDNEPDLGSTGYPYTWASDLSQFMKHNTSFVCPEARPEEITKVEGEHGVIDLTYGMYEPYGGYLRTIVPNPDQTVLIIETSNHGSNGSFDPLPYKDSSGKEIPWDGFVVGWNNTNDKPNDQSSLVTRLAFPESAGGKFNLKDPSRHDGGIIAINCSGSLLPLIRPHDAVVRMKGGLPSGYWEAPASSATSH